MISRISIMLVILLSAFLLTACDPLDGKYGTYLGENEYGEKCSIALTLSFNGEFLFLETARTPTNEREPVSSYKFKIEKERADSAVRAARRGSSWNDGNLTAYDGEFSLVDENKSELSVRIEDGEIVSFSTLQKYDDYMLLFYRCSELKREEGGGK